MAAWWVVANKWPAPIGLCCPPWTWPSGADSFRSVERYPPKRCLHRTEVKPSSWGRDGLRYHCDNGDVAVFLMRSVTSSSTSRASCVTKSSYLNNTRYDSSCRYCSRRQESSGDDDASKSISAVKANQWNADRRKSDRRWSKVKIWPWQISCCCFTGSNTVKR